MKFVIETTAGKPLERDLYQVIAAAVASLPMLSSRAKVLEVMLKALSAADTELRVATVRLGPEHK